MTKKELQRKIKKAVKANKAGETTTKQFVLDVTELANSFAARASVEATTLAVEATMQSLRNMADPNFKPPENE